MYHNDLLPEHRKHFPHEEVAEAAYHIWLAEGCPWGDDDITFSNWIDAEVNLSDPAQLVPLPPVNKEING